MSLFWRSRDRGSAPSERRGAEIQGWPSVGTWAQPAYTAPDAAVGHNAERSIAVGASIDLITSLITELPIDVYTGQGADARQITTPSYLLDPDGTGYGVQDWGTQLLASWLTRGNAFGNVLQRQGGRFPTQVQLVAPDAVRPQVEKDGTLTWWVGGQQVEDMWHTRANERAGLLFGLSAVTMHAASIGLNIVGTRFGLQWFIDGAHPGGLLSNSEVELSQAQARTAKDRFMAALRGTREPLVLGKGWKYEQIQLNPEESQFLDTNKFSAAECCRMFGPGLAEIFGYETGGSLTYQTVQSKAVQLNVYTLGKWMRRYERVLTAMLPRPQYVKLNRNALLEQTTTERFAAYAIALKNGWKVINEVRELEGDRPVPWGNEPFIPAPEPPSDPNADPNAAPTAGGTP